MAYDKMNEYVESLFNVFKMVNMKAEKQKDRKFKMIALVIYNYTLKMAKDNEVDLRNVGEDDTGINLIPIFEYIAYNNIELYDFNKIDITDVDVSKREDLERFVLTHVYYITQKI